LEEGGGVNLSLSLYRSVLCVGRLCFETKECASSCSSVASLLGVFFF